MHKNLGMVRESFPKLFGDKAYPMVTECMVQAARNDQSTDKNVVKLMASFERAPCGHQGNLRSAEDCLRECFAEPRYCLAGRSKWSMKMAYYFPHVLVIMWDLANVLVMRAPSDTAKEMVEAQMETKRFHVGDVEKRLTKEALAEEKRERVERNKALTAKIAYNIRYHHKPIAKGPNPNSIRKPMTESERSKKRSARNPYMQFGGASTNGANPFDDPSFISRSKMRKKRKRLEEAEYKALVREENQHTSTETSTPIDSTNSPSSPSAEPNSSAIPKIRKRRKPKTKTQLDSDEQTHKFRESELQKDAQMEASVSAN